MGAASMFRFRGRTGLVRAGALVLGLAASAGAARASDLTVCADDRVASALLSQQELKAAEAACSRVLAGTVDDAERQKAAYFRGLMRFLAVVQAGAAPKPGPGGAPGAYVPPTPAQVGPALADVETAIATAGPLRAEALALRITIHQTTGAHATARAQIDGALGEGAGSATLLVQRALEHERAGDAAAAMADLDRAIGVDPRSGPALFARAELQRRLGLLGFARADYTAAAALGPPFRRLSLTRKSDVELRGGDLRAAYDDLLAATRQGGDLPKAELAAANAALLVQAGDLALDKLKDPEAAARHFAEAARLAPPAWEAQLGLARVEEQRGDRARAMAIYRRILEGTRATPRLVERLVASLRLRQLTRPAPKGATDLFRSGLDAGTAVGKGAADGLRRVAFVIGASEYGELASLPNARRDAAVVAHALAEMGFDAVEIAENPGAADLRRMPGLIAQRAAEADIVLVFYAGHGFETGGVNYLIPVDAAPESDRDLERQALDLGDLTAAAARARRGSLVIVDACRDDPFVEARAAQQARGSGGTAARPPQATTSVVFHSTQPGQPALDGDDLDSPFVRSLLETLAAPGQPLDTVVSDTTRRVAERTQGRQVPAAYGAVPSVALLPARPR